MNEAVILQYKILKKRQSCPNKMRYARNNNRPNGIYYNKISKN
jgi:hypothetical protein